MQPDAAITGLSAAEVAERIRAGQTNQPLDSRWLEYRDIAVRNLATLFNLLVVPAAIALFLLHEYPAAWSVSALALGNSLIGLVQEVRAKRHLDQLALLTENRARVMRDGKEQAIPASAVVLGDSLLLAAGDVVVADGVVVSAKYLEIDEALLTGESTPRPCRPGDALISGSACVAGEGAYTVTKIGASSFVQQLATEARQYRHLRSPMQQTLDALIRWLSAIAVVLCLGYAALYFVRGFDQADLWQMIAATVTSMVPQGLVLMSTLAFTLSALRMTQRGAVVQRLNAVESMASLDVLCLDKTGTLTTGQTVVDQVCAVDGEESARERLRLFAWASVDDRNKSIQALRAEFAELATEVVDALPFKAQNRYSAVRVRADGVERTLVLGAVETLLPHLAEVAWAEDRCRELSPTGLRLLLFAEGHDPLPSPPVLRGRGVGGEGVKRDEVPSPSPPTPRPLSTGGEGSGWLSGMVLNPLALVALRDELRPNAGSVLEALATQGIACKILSGDSPETIHATLRHLKLPVANDPVATGADLEAASDAAEFVRTHSVFGRVSPSQKWQIVQLLQADKKHVGMQGDGVNDLLAIKRADLGIAMGAGSAAAKTVAGLVLETNDFAVLPAALAEGQAVLHNLRRAAKLFLLKNVYTLFLIVLLLGFVGRAFPYLPQQVTLLNSLTIGGPALLILIRRQAPRGTSREPFLREAGIFALTSGLATGVMGLAGWLIAAQWLGDDVAGQRTLLLATLTIAGLGNVLRLADGDRLLIGWTAVALAIFVAAMYVPQTALFFKLTPLTPVRWALAAGLAAIAVTIPAVRPQFTFREPRSRAIREM